MAVCDACLWKSYLWICLLLFTVVSSLRGDAPSQWSRVCIYLLLCLCCGCIIWRACLCDVQFAKGVCEDLLHTLPVNQWIEEKKRKPSAVGCASILKHIDSVIFKIAKWSLNNQLVSMETFLVRCRCCLVRGVPKEPKLRWEPLLFWPHLISCNKDYVYYIILKGTFMLQRKCK